MTFSRLLVRWEMTDPPVAPSAWAKIPHAGTPEDAPLEGPLGWPEGTLAALRAGFGKKLDRGTGWEAASGDASLAVKTAAAQFRRGVAYRARTEPSSERRHQGAYEIVVSSASDAPASFDDADFFVIDARVSDAWPKLPKLKHRFVADLSEHSKSLASVAAMIAAWRRSGSPKSWTIIGGGIVADVAAYAAALAECKMTLVPTTLLAMADACIGGKTGVNFAPFGKNQLGRFYFPERVLVWTGWLKTLPPREIVAGGAECLKHAMLAGDMPLMGTLADALSKRSLDQLRDQLTAVIRVKAEVVAKDPAERGERATLNLGHTLGHALEAMSQANTRGVDTILHGEAVGLGLAFALILSQRVGGLATSESRAMLTALRQAGLIMAPAELCRRLGVSSHEAPNVFATLLLHIQQDKKNLADQASSEWVLLRKPGETARTNSSKWTVTVDSETLSAAWQDFLQKIRA